MKKIIVLGAGAMGSAFTVPCIENNNDVTLIGTHLEDEAIQSINNNNNFHKVLKEYFYIKLVIIKLKKMI